MKNYHLTNYNTLVAILFCCGLSFFCSGASLKVTFFDVGQGNCALVTCGDHPPLLVDCGSSNFAYRGAHFKEQQISKISAALKACASATFFLVVSHPDTDHYNWLPDVLSEAETNSRHVGNAWLGGMESHYISKKESKSTRSLISSLKGNLGTAYSSRVTFPTANGPTRTPLNILTTGDLTYMILPALPCSTGADKEKESNAASLVVQIVYHGKVILLPGDATARTFSHIGAFLAKPILVMLASHHGAEPSESKDDACNDENLIRATEPYYVIFSSGRRGGYLHPRLKTVTSYAKMHETLGHQVNWHPLFCGIPSSQDKISDNTLLSFESNYAAILTNKPVLSTLTHGTIVCKISRQDNGTVNLDVDMDYPAIFDSEKTAALVFPLLEQASAFGHSEISGLRLNNLAIDDSNIKDAERFADLIKALISKCPQLKTLLLNNNVFSRPTTVDNLVTLLEKVDIREFELKGSHIKLSSDETQKLVTAWAHRGLKLQAAVSN
jgi:beta-lactamase superfamily II metal-dependent hydrolase